MALTNESKRVAITSALSRPISVSIMTISIAPSVVRRMAMLSGPPLEAKKKYPGNRHAGNFHREYSMTSSMLHSLQPQGRQRERSLAAVAAPQQIEIFRRELEADDALQLFDLGLTRRRLGYPVFDHDRLITYRCPVLAEEWRALRLTLTSLLARCGRSATARHGSFRRPAPAIRIGLHESVLISGDLCRAQ